MPGKKGTSAPPRKRRIERYEHTDKKRINNPPVGLVTPQTDPVAPTHKTYDYIKPVPWVTLMTTRLGTARSGVHGRLMQNA